MKKIKYTLIFVLLLFLSGCIYSIDAQLDKNSNPLKPTLKLAFIKARIIHMPGRFGEMIFSLKDGNEWRTIWEISPETSQEINEITYGEVPAGFKEVQKAEPLQIGREYKVGIYYGDMGKILYFKIKEQSGKPIIQIKDN